MDIQSELIFGNRMVHLPMNDTLVHQQLSLHHLHYFHPSERLPKRFFPLRDVTFALYVRIPTCIERATVRFGLILRTMIEYGGSMVEYGRVW